MDANTWIGRRPCCTTQLRDVRMPWMDGDAVAMVAHPMLPTATFVATPIRTSQQHGSSARRWRNTTISTGDCDRWSQRPVNNRHPSCITSQLPKPLTSLLSPLLVGEVITHCAAGVMKQGSGSINSSSWLPWLLSATAPYANFGIPPSTSIAARRRFSTPLLHNGPSLC